MIPAQIPGNEAERLAALLEYDVLDTDPEQGFDDLTRIASDVCGTPIALVSLVDGERQWFKSKVGLDASETPRRVAFCSHAILEPGEVFVVPDSSEDERFHDNPLAVDAPHVRFYAGAPLVNAEGLAVGTLCVIDNEPRELAPEQLETLRALARQVVSQLELRKQNAELRELSTEVQRANEELRGFTSMAAHDLREPLRRIVEFSDIVVEDLGAGRLDAAVENLEYIVDGGRRMNGLIDALLDLSGAQSGVLSHELVDLGDCAHLALDALGTRVTESGAQVEVGPLPSVLGDEHLLTQVFQNLIGNALKFTDDGCPVIRVTCVVEDGEVTVGVKDQGIGMEAKYAESIFASFARLHSCEAFEGAGIGLAITRKVVERHGGRIWAESSPGEGAHFRFTLEGMALPDAQTLAA